MTGETTIPESYGARAASLAAGALPWLAQRRTAAFARFQEVGFPSRRVEAWKYTDLARALRAQDFRPLAEAGSLAGPDLLPGRLADKTYRIVFVNGRHRPELSDENLPEGLRIASLGPLLASELGDLTELTSEGPEQPLFDLNTALMEDGAAIALADGLVLQRPIELLFLGGLTQTPAAYHPRLLVTLGRNAAATLIEHHRGLGDTAYFANSASEISLSEAAHLDHLRLQDEALTALHVGTCRLRLARAATYNGFLLSLGAALSRQEVKVQLDGEAAECSLNGVYLLRDRQHGDITTRLEHKAPHTISRETFKGALNGMARAVFQGKIVVEAAAQKTDGRMLNKTLLLSDGAEIDSKPELEIYADDVLCAHGATAGEIDGEALFYLRARGIPEERARSLLVEAFLTDALDGFGVAILRPALDARLAAWLALHNEV